MIDNSIVALSDDDVAFSGSRPGTSGQGNSGKAGRKSTGKRLSPAQKAAATRRQKKRAGMSAAEKRAETRAFKAKAGRKGGKKVARKKATAAAPARRTTGKKTLPKKKKRS